MLRGPQTVSELRANSERLHRFADLSAVEGFLDELAARAGGEGRAAGRAAGAGAGLARGALGAAADRPGRRDVGGCRRCGDDDDDFVAVSELAALKAPPRRGGVARSPRCAAQLDRVCAELDIPRR